MESSCVGGVVTKLRDGMFEIDDRGDAIAEIQLNGNFGEISEEDISVWAEWDRKHKREPIHIPVGFKMTGMIIGFVHGLTVQPMDDDGHYIGPDVVSAFPGLASISGAPQERVESLRELELYLETNINVAFDLLNKHSHQTAAQ